MKEQIGMLKMVNRIIDDYDNLKIWPEDFEKRLKQYQTDLYDYCSAYEEAEYQQYLDQQKEALE